MQFASLRALARLVKVRQTRSPSFSSPCPLLLAPKSCSMSSQDRQHPAKRCGRNRSCQFVCFISFFFVFSSMPAQNGSSTSGGAAGSDGVLETRQGAKFLYTSESVGEGHPGERQDLMALKPSSQFESFMLL